MASTFACSSLRCGSYDENIATIKTAGWRYIIWERYSDWKRGKRREKWGRARTGRDSTECLLRKAVRWCSTRRRMHTVQEELCLTAGQISHVTGERTIDNIPARRPSRQRWRHWWWGWYNKRDHQWRSIVVVRVQPLAPVINEYCGLYMKGLYIYIFVDFVRRGGSLQRYHLFYSWHRLKLDTTCAQRSLRLTISLNRLTMTNRHCRCCQEAQPRAAAQQRARTYIIYRWCTDNPPWSKHTVKTSPVNRTCVI